MMTSGTGKGTSAVLHVSVLLTLVAAWLAGVLPQRALAAAFTTGNLVVLRIGDGAGALTSAATAVFLDEFTGAGALAQSIAMPTAISGPNRVVTNSGTATSEGALNLSADGRFLTLAGYDAAPGTAGVVAAAGPARVVARIDATGVVDTSTQISDGYSANNIRSAVTDDGTRFWTGGTGTGGGTRFVLLGSPGSSTQVSPSLTNTRVTAIFGGQLYISSASGAFQGVSKVDSGLPTTNGQTTTLLPGFPTASGPSPYAFVLLDLDPGVAGIDTAYVADDRGTGSGGGIQKWSFNGTTWTLSYTINGASVRGLTADTSGSSVVLYATTTETSANRLVRVTDTGASSVFTTIATAAPNTVFRGVAFAPQSAPSAPVITGQPANQIVAFNTSATLSVGAVGAAPLGYQWYAGASGDTTNPIAGATTSTFTTPPLTSDISYWVRVSNAVGSADSSTATITVGAPAPPVITIQPVSQLILAGTTATLTVAATGTPPFGYQWYAGTSGSVGSPIGGAITASFTTPALAADASFWVRVTNIAGSADSNTAAITVTTATHIHDIQGRGHISPFVTTVNDNRTSFGSAVANVPGIVTALNSNGFYLQDPSPDNDPNTSEGIFVFTGATGLKPAVGDAVLVNGAVAEFRSGCTSASCTSSSSAWNNLTTTELSANSAAGVTLTWTLVSSGNALPAPVVIGAGGRIPPATVIEDDVNGSIETSPNVFDPATDGIDFYESLEGMRVQINDAVATGPTGNFTSNHEIPVLVDNGSGSGLRTPRGGIILGENYSDFNPERIILNDLITGGPTLPTVSVGDTFPGVIVGVMDYTFGNYKLQVASLPAVVSGGLQKEVTNLIGGAGRLTVADFNIENFTPTGNPRIAPTAQIIVNNLRAPDLLAIQEVQDNSGSTSNGVVAADQTIKALTDAIVAAGGPTYEFREIDPVDGQDGGEPGGNIRQVLLFRTDRGLAFVDRPGGDATTPNIVQNTGGAPQLRFSPGRIDPGNPAWTSSRKPLAAEFTFNGQTLFVINNHFNSKGGDQPLYGRFQPPVNSSEVQRQQQAQIVHDFVRDILTIDPNAAVVVVGDLNDFHFSPTLNLLKQGVLTDLMETLPPNERYTYDFEGNAQSLDHILVSGRLGPVAEYDVVHVNSEFQDQTSDHDPSVARFTFLPPPQANPDSYTTQAGTTLNVSAGQGILANDRGGRLGIITHTNPSHGTLTLNLDGSFTYTPQPGYAGPDSFSYTTSNAAQLYRTNLQPLGTFGGVEVTAGAFGSSIYPVPGSADELYGLTDRGPNVDGPNGTKVEPIPSFTPSIAKFKFADGQATLEQVIPLQDANGNPYSGRVSSQAGTGEVITDLNGNVLPPDVNGYDPEGLVALPDGTFWVSDEYGPFITHFDATGKQIGRLSPFDGSLPAELRARLVNRGMEGLTITPDGSTLVGIMQSALQQSDLGTFDAKKLTPLRIVTYRLIDGATHEYLYLLDNPDATRTAVSEITALSSTTFLIDERDGNFPPGAYKKLYAVDIAGATDVGPGSTVPGATYSPAGGGLLVGGKTIENLLRNGNTPLGTAASAAALALNGITPVSKTLFLDVGDLLTTLDPQGRFFSHDKLEGVAAFNNGATIVISNDSDFGIDGVTGTAPPFQLHAKISPATGQQDDGEFLVIDMTRLPAALSTATVTINTVDTIAPDTVLDSVPSNPTNTPAAGFIFHGIDTGTGVARFECALDAASFAGCASGVSYGGLAAGSHTFAVRAIDAAGNIDATPAGYVWTIDSTGPVVMVPSDILAEATGPAGAIVTFTVTAVDAVDGAVPVTCAPASGSTFAFGETTVSCTATDRLGNSGRGSFRVTVADTKAPVLTLPGNITVEAGSANGAKVSYSASAVDLVDGAVSVVCTPASGSSFPLGVTNVHCVTADRRGNTASGDFTVTVRDTTAPTIFAVLSVPTILFPADGKMKPVTVLALAADSVSAVTCRITAITGNDGATSDDWQITGRLTANLRARHSPHAIRLYSLTASCSDATGNASTTTAFVVVP